MSREGIGGNHAGEVSIAHYLNSGELFRRAGVERLKRCVVTIGAKHGAKDHSRPDDIGGVSVLSGYKVAGFGFGRGGSGDLPIAGRREALLRGDDSDQILAASEPGISNGAGGLRIGDRAIGCLQGFRSEMPTLGGHFQQHVARSRSHGAQLRPHGGRGAAAKGAHVPRGQAGIAHDHYYGLKRNPQLLGGELGERSADVLPHFDLAGKNPYLAVGRNVQPCAYIFG